MKKLISLLLTLVMVFSVPSSVYALETQPVNVSGECEIEISLDELEHGGITVALTSDDKRREVVGTFHVGLTYTPRTQAAHLHWEAKGSQITNVTAHVFCIDTNIKGPTYYSDTINEYDDSDGRYDVAYGNCPTFYIKGENGEPVEKVKVGFRYAYVTMVKKGRTSAAPSAEVVTLE